MTGINLVKGAANQRQWRSRLPRTQGKTSTTGYRHGPGTGEINYDFLFEFLDRLPYDGWVGCEYKPLTNNQRVNVAGAASLAGSLSLLAGAAGGYIYDQYEKGKDKNPPKSNSTKSNSTKTTVN